MLESLMLIFVGSVGILTLVFIISACVLAKKCDEWRGGDDNE